MYVHKERPYIRIFFTSFLPFKLVTCTILLGSAVWGGFFLGAPLSQAHVDRTTSPQKG